MYIRKGSNPDKENSICGDVTSSSPRDQEEDINDDDDVNKDSASSVDARADLKNYQGFFRELDLDVFLILGSGLFSKSIMDSDHHTKVNFAVKPFDETYDTSINTPLNFVLLLHRPDARNKQKMRQK